MRGVQYVMELGQLIQKFYICTQSNYFNKKFRFLAIHFKMTAIQLFSNWRKSKNKGNDHETMHLSTTPDPGHHMGT